MAIGDTSRDLQLEDGKGIISHVNEYTYLEVRITKDGNHEPEINDRINKRTSSYNKAKQHFVGPRCDPQNKESYLSCNKMVFKSRNGSKTKFHRNGLLATLSSNFQEGQN